MTGIPPAASLTDRDFKFAADWVYGQGKRAYFWMIALYPVLCLAPVLSIFNRWWAIASAIAVGVASVVLSVLKAISRNRMALGALLQAREDRIRFAELVGLPLIWTSPLVSDADVRRWAGKEIARLGGQQHQFPDQSRVVDFMGAKARGATYVRFAQLYFLRLLMSILTVSAVVFLVVWLLVDNTVDGMLLRGLPLVLPGTLIMIDEWVSRRSFKSEFEEFLAHVGSPPTGHQCFHGVQVLHDQLRRSYPAVPNFVFWFVKRRLAT